MSQGAAKAVKQTEHVGRATTRLGQASASTGRQFSAQASGLGGLVAAYAGAAATIFAVTQAFAALNRAAQAEQVIKGTRALALEVGQSGDVILAKVIEITKGQLSLAEAAQSTNIALSAGFGAEQIERLTAVSLKASRALGRTLVDAFTRLTRGTAKLEPELLDELGIFVRIEPAVEKYAAQIGRAANTLSQFERRQAFVNATIEEGERKFGIIDVSTESTLEGFEKLSATFKDLARTFGSILGDTLVPLAKFFSNNLGNSLLLFLGVGRLVFGKATQLIGAFATQAIGNIGRVTDSMVANSVKAVDMGESIRQAQIAAQSSVGGFAGGTRGQAAAAAAARDRAAAGDVSLRTMIKDRQALEDVTTNEKKYKRSVALSNKSREQKLKLIKMSTTRTQFASATLVQYNGVISASSAKNIAFAMSANVAAAAARGMGVALRFLMTSMNILFMVVGAAQLIGTIFDIDILGGIVRWFKDLGAESRKTAKGIAGVVSAATMDAEVAARLKEKFKPAEFKEIGEVAAEALSEPIRVGKIGAEAKQGWIKFSSDLQSMLGGALAETEAFETIIKRIQKDLGIELKVFKGQGTSKGLKVLNETVDSLYFAAERAAVIMMRLAEAQHELSTETDASKQKELHIVIQGLNIALTQVLNRTSQFGRLSAEMSELTGVPVQRLVTAYSAMGPIFTLVGDKLRYAGQTVGEFNRKTEEYEHANNKLWDGMQRGIVASTLFNDLLVRTQDAFDRGAISAETMSQKVGALDGIINRLGKSLAPGSKDLKAFKEELMLLGFTDPIHIARIIASLRKEVKRLGEQRDEIKALSDELIRLESIGKTLRRLFGKELKMFDEAAALGLVKIDPDTGAIKEFAKDQARINTLKQEFLEAQFSEKTLSQDAIDLLKKHGTIQAVLGQDTAAVNQNIREEFKNITTSLKAAIGAAPKLRQELEKLTVQFTKFSEGVQATTEQLGMKKSLNDAKNGLTELTASQNSYNKAYAETIKYSEIVIQRQEQLITLEQQRLEMLESAAEAWERQADTAGQLVAAESALNIALAQGRGAATLGKSERNLAMMERSENLHTAEEIRKKREEIAKIEYNNAITVLRLQRAQSKKEHDAKLTLLRVEKLMQGLRNAQMADELVQRKTLLEYEAVLRGDKQATELKTLTDNNARLAKQEAIIKAEGDLARRAITVRETAKLAELKILQERASQIAMQAGVFRSGGELLEKVFGTFVKGVNALVGSDIKPADIVTSRAALTQIETDATNLVIEMAAVERQIRSNAVSERKMITDTEDMKERIRQETRTSNNEQILDMENRHILENKIAQDEADLATKMLEQKITSGALEIQSINNLIEAEDFLQQARRQGFAAEAEELQRNYELKMALIQRERDSILNFLDDLSGKLQGRFKEGIDSLLQSISEGTLTLENFREGFKEWIFNILGDLQQSIVDEFVTKPIQEFVKEGMGSLADLFKPESEKGAEVQSIQDLLIKQSDQELDIFERTKLFEQANVQQVFVVNMPGEGLSGRGRFEDNFDGDYRRQTNDRVEADNALSDASAKASLDVEKLGVTAAATFGAVLLATGDFKKSMIATFLAMFLQIAMMQAQTWLSSLGSASGGAVGLAGARSVRRFAAGGGVFQRDRIPALLEPGEFVIRKPMAKAIGGPALERMNAHGQTPSANIEVNMINKGTPQQAKAQQKPKLDGKGIVVDIVLTDLQNNGPIKQAIRGGGRR